MNATATSYPTILIHPDVVRAILERRDRMRAEDRRRYELIRDAKRAKAARTGCEVATAALDLDELDALIPPHAFCRHHQRARDRERAAARTPRVRRKSTAPEAVLAALGASPAPLTVRDLAAAAGFSESHAFTVAQGLLRDGRAARRKVPGTRLIDGRPVPYPVYVYSAARTAS